MTTSPHEPENQAVELAAQEVGLPRAIIDISKLYTKAGISTCDFDFTSVTAQKADPIIASRARPTCRGAMI